MDWVLNIIRPNTNTVRNFGITFCHYKSRYRKNYVSSFTNRTLFENFTEKNWNVNVAVVVIIICLLISLIGGHWFSQHPRTRNIFHHHPCEQGCSTVLHYLMNFLPGVKIGQSLSKNMANRTTTTVEATTNDNYPLWHENSIMGRE